VASYPSRKNSKSRSRSAKSARGMGPYLLGILLGMMHAPSRSWIVQVEHDFLQFSDARLSVRSGEWRGAIVPILAAPTLWSTPSPTGLSPDYQVSSGRSRFSSKTERFSENSTNSPAGRQFPSRNRHFGSRQLNGMMRLYGKGLSAAYVITKDKKKLAFAA